MTHAHYILGMAGHTDHGKSALVQALTGINPDRLPEEKNRGMTIDLGYAHLELPSRKNPDVEMQIDIIDVPGHASFIKNMVSGVGSIDAALFVVAADDLWMPQSEEHLQILEYLGIEHAVFALTKADLLEDCSDSISRLRNQLKGSALKGSPIVATSIVDGRGIQELKDALSAMLSEVTAKADLGKPRLAVDRTFSQQGFGTIVTGTLTGGSFQVGQSAIVQPKNLACRIRSMQIHNSAVETAIPGTRVALNLSDLEIANKGQPGVSRGDVITFANLGKPTELIDVYLTRSERETLVNQPLKHASKVHFYSGTAQQAATVYLLEDKNIAEGKSTVAKIKLSHPEFLFIGDHFLLRNWSKTSTLAGGRVLQTHSNRPHHKNKHKIELLKKKHASINCLSDFILLIISQQYESKLSELMKQSNFSEPAIRRSVENLESIGKLLTIRDSIVDRAWWENLQIQAEAYIDNQLKSNPQLTGISVSVLRAYFEDKLQNKDLQEQLIESLMKRGFKRTENLIARFGHQQKLPEHLKSTIARIRKELQADVLNPPARREIASDKLARDAIAYLISQGEVVNISEKLVMSAVGFHQAKSRVQEHLEKNETATLAEIRDLLGSSRRIVVPLIEKLDQERFTVRVGDLRKLKQ